MFKVIKALGYYLGLFLMWLALGFAIGFLGSVGVAKSKQPILLIPSAVLAVFGGWASKQLMLPEWADDYRWTSSVCGSGGLIGYMLGCYLAWLLGIHPFPG